jgi:hypothetical protein
VLKHDPAAAPLSAAYRHTENAINVPLGKGMWQSASALGKVQRKYVDPVSGQAAYYGIVEENGGELAIVTARLRIDDRKIVEAEWFIAARRSALARESQGALTDHGLAAPWLRGDASNGSG